LNSSFHFAGATARRSAKYEERTQHLIWDIHDTLDRRCLAAIRNLCRLTNPRNYQRDLIANSVDFLHADYLYERWLCRTFDGPFTDRRLLCLDSPCIPDMDKMKKQNKTVVATAGNVPLSLRSGHPFSAVPHL
jgi:hypothetical protein